MQFSSSTDREAPSRLLALPIELRRHIYSYVLPSTSTFDVRLQRKSDKPERSEYNLTLVRENVGEGVWKMQKTSPKTDRETGNDIVWLRGSIGILGTNKQVHEECVDMIYGDSIFVIDVAFDSIKLRYRWLILSSNLTPTRSINFLDHFSQRNLLRMRNYIINVEHVDNYTGMIKYNYGGRGLTAGIIQQIQNLVDLLSFAPHLHRVNIHLIDGAISRVRFPSGRIHRVQDEKNYSESEKVLEPFKRLCGVRQAQVTGVSAAFSESLERTMMASRDAPA